MSTMRKKAKGVPEGAQYVYHTETQTIGTEPLRLGKDQVLAAEIRSEGRSCSFCLLTADRDWHRDFNAAFLDANGSLERPR